MALKIIKSCMISMSRSVPTIRFITFIKNDNKTVTELLSENISVLYISIKAVKILNMLLVNL